MLNKTLNANKMKKLRFCLFFMIQPLCAEKIFAKNQEYRRGTQSGYEVTEEYDGNNYKKTYRGGEIRDKELVSVGNISAKDLKQISMRRESLNLWGYEFGPYYSQNLNSKAMMYAISMTNHREVGLNAEIRTRFGGAWSEDGKAYLGSATVGGAYIPMLQDVSPLFGAEFGFGVYKGDDVKSVAGFSGALLFGVRLFRTSNTQMEILVRYEQSIKENEKGRPVSYGAGLAVLL